MENLGTPRKGTRRGADSEGNDYESQEKKQGKLRYSNEPQRGYTNQQVTVNESKAVNEKESRR